MIGCVEDVRKQSQCRPPDQSVSVCVCGMWEDWEGGRREVGEGGSGFVCEREEEDVKCAHVWREKVVIGDVVSEVEHG